MPQITECGVPPWPDMQDLINNCTETVPQKRPTVIITTIDICNQQEFSLAYDILEQMFSLCKSQIPEYDLKILEFMAWKFLAYGKPHKFLTISIDPIKTYILNYPKVLKFDVWHCCIKVWKKIEIDFKNWKCM